LRVVPRMTEDLEVRQLVQRLFRQDESVRGKRCQTLDGLGVLRYFTMAHHAPGRRGEAGPLAGERLRMAVHALDLQPGMALVAERQRLARPRRCRHGKEYATKESEK